MPRDRRTHAPCSSSGGIDEIYTATPFYGIRKITAQLHVEGVQVNHKAVARHVPIWWMRATITC